MKVATRIDLAAPVADGTRNPIALTLRDLDDEDTYGDLRELLRDVIRSCLAGLPDLQAQALALHYEANLPLFDADPEICTVASAMNCSPEDVRRLVLEGREALRYRYGEECAVPEMPGGETGPGVRAFIAARVEKTEPDVAALTREHPDEALALARAVRHAAAQDRSLSLEQSWHARDWAERSAGGRDTTFGAIVRETRIERKTSLSALANALAERKP